MMTYEDEILLDIQVMAIPDTSHTPAPPNRLAFCFTMQVRHGRPLFEHFDNRQIAQKALFNAAARHDIHIDSIATTPSTLTVTADVDPKTSAALTLNRLKTAAAIALRDAHPELPELRTGGVFYRGGAISPVVPATAHTHARTQNEGLVIPSLASEELAQSSAESAYMSPCTSDDVGASHA